MEMMACLVGGRAPVPGLRASQCLEIATGDAVVPTADIHEGWEYVRDPLPSRQEDPAFDRIRRSLDASDTQWQFTPESLERISRAIQRVQLQNGLLPNYGERFNPLLRCIVRRTRAYLETTINPVTGEAFLPKVSVKLFGEGSRRLDQAQRIPARGLSRGRDILPLLQQRVRGAGFFKTLLLRRLGSSMEAGRLTVSRLLSAEPE